MTAAHSFEFIELTYPAEGVALITFNRPKVRNALHLPMNLEIREALRILQAEGNTQVLIVTGAGGKAFVSGADIAELRDRRGPEALPAHNAQLCDAIERFPHPTIAAIEGYALGGGCEVAIACDLRVAGHSAKLGQPETSLGIIPAAGGTWRLPRLVGVAKAKELIFTAAIIGAEEAERIGLVNQVVRDGEVLGAALAMAQRITAQSTMAVRLAKVAIQAGRESSQHTGTMLEALSQTVLYDDDEKMTRMTNFVESRAHRRAKRAAETQELADE